MLTPLLVLFFGIASLALVTSILLTLHAWEHRRYARTSFKQELKRPGSGHVAVIVPCKGVEFSLADNLRRLLVQDYDDYEVHFVVESAADLACSVIRKLIAEKPKVAVQLIVAGRATNCGQKIHNLSVATGRLDETVKTVVFVDSDAAPERDWLARLVAPLIRCNVNAVTSYRWFVPRRATLANLLLCSINATAMGLVCSRRQAVLWGGSWAISQKAFSQTDVRLSWQGCLSDDLIASQRMDKMRLNVKFEPQCVVTSSVDYDGKAMWEFLRRQCFVGRWYRTRTWLLSLAFTTVSMTTFWGGLILAVILSMSGFQIAAGSSLAVACSLWAMASVRAIWRHDAGRLFVQKQTAELEWARLFDICAYPLVLAVSWLGILSAAVGRSVWWRGIGYRIGKRGKVVLLANENGPSENEPSFLLADWVPQQALSRVDDGPATIVLPSQNQSLRDATWQRNVA